MGTPDTLPHQMESPMNHDNLTHPIFKAGPSRSHRKCGWLTQRRFAISSNHNCKNSPIVSSTNQTSSTIITSISMKSPTVSAGQSPAAHLRSRKVLFGTFSSKRKYNPITSRYCSFSEGNGHYASLNPSYKDISCNITQS